MSLTQGIQSDVVEPLSHLRKCLRQRSAPIKMTLQQRAQSPRDRQRLTLIHQARNVSHIHLMAVQHQALRPQSARTARAATLSLRSLGQALGGQREIRQARVHPRLTVAHLAGLRGGVNQAVTVHDQHLIGHIQIITTAAHHNQGGNAALAVQGADAIHQRGDRFTLRTDQGTHTLIANQQVSGASVLIQQQGGLGGLSPQLQGFHDRRRLRSRARRIGGGELGWVCVTPRQMGNERPQVDAGNRTPVGGAHRHCFGHGSHQFTPITGDMRVNTPGNGV